MITSLSFDGISEFVAVAETQGFTSAAKRLNVSTSHISRQIAKVEKRLGVALFARTTRQVKLTDAGHSYYQRCQSLLDGLAQANEAISDHQVELAGTLRVSAAGEFAELYIVPVLLEFAKQHPKLNIDIDFNSKYVDFVQEGIDFSIRYGQLKDSSLVARKLVDRQLVAAASPAYLQKHGTPKTPQDLINHDCIVAISDHWRFESKNKEITVKVKPKWRSNSGRSLVQAVEAGMGISYMPQSSYGNSLINKNLVPILAPFWKKQIPTWIVYANKQYLPARARLAIDFLVEHFKDWQDDQLPLLK
ncbi:LysR family transcriptional regulator [Psychrosphaera aestuarii]|uniref:LysR family transcriptional regulator n=1 Tax=Psychrosphaera aestuarii TaxID=1266052 RepID=UPI001B31A5CD|nr:LysR family transcriptional regulator [Psychrosphaera aestuarii]